MIRKILIANRGEIAVRIARTAREMGIKTVAVYSDADRGALHVRVCDEAYHIGSAIAAESYLVVGKIMDVVKKSGADAIHPGYGFLSENKELVGACEKAGVTFIGPPSSAMSMMGSKTAARAKMIEAGVPVVPGANPKDAAEAKELAKDIGYPIMLKAAAGGGGKGMRLVHEEGEIESAWDRARSEAKKSFGDDTVYMEKAIIRPRHVEIQVLADRHGNCVHLFERDCSIQRRHQKVVEETPCPQASRDLVAEMGRVAVQGAKAVGYHSAGTFEFLLAEDGNFYFLEMNTRLQVEHPITEWITGVDLVEQMIRVAQGEKLPFAQSDIRANGASIECRVYAEDPSKNFIPSPGDIQDLKVPGGAFVRDDSGAYPGCTISSFYDPLVSKLSVWGPTREQAVARMRRALSEYVVTGIKTNLSFHEKLFAHEKFQAGDYHTGFIDEHADRLLGYDTGDDDPEAEKRLAVALALVAAQREAAQAGDSDEGKAKGGLSPWLSQHRSRSLR